MWGWIARCAHREIPDDEVATRLEAALVCVRTIEARLAGAELGSISAAASALRRLRAVLGPVAPADFEAASEAAGALTTELGDMRRALDLARRAKVVTTETDAPEPAAASIRTRSRRLPS